MPRMNIITGWSSERLTKHMAKVELPASGLATLCGITEQHALNMMCGKADVLPRVIAVLRLFSSTHSHARRQIVQQIEVELAQPLEWRTVADYPAYEISSGGEVRHDGRILRATPARSGHVKVSLYNGTKFGTKARGWRVQVHTLVALAFLGPPPFPGAIVRHRNGHPHDNRPDNLAWGTHRENTEDRVKHNRFGKPALEKHWTVRKKTRLFPKPQPHQEVRK